MTSTEYMERCGEHLADIMNDWYGITPEPECMSDADMAADLQGNGIECYTSPRDGKLYAYLDPRFDDIQCMTGMTVAAFLEFLEEVTA